MHQVRLFFIALQFFTRLPIPRWVGFDPAWLNQAARYFPLVGMVVALITGAVYVASFKLFPPAIAAILSTAAGIYVTGAFHEDGFADTCDGLGGGMTKGTLDFDAFYSTSNPADATTFANGFLGAAKTAFGAVDHLGYAIAGSNGAQVYSPAAASGLVMQAQYRAGGSDFYSNQADVNLTRNFQTAHGNHDVKLGFYGSGYGLTSKTVYNDMLIEVQGKPRTLDLLAYSASGAVLGKVTDNGVLRYSTTLNQGDVDARMGALYVNDTWEVMDGLRLDGGVRKERYDYDGYALLTKQGCRWPPPGPTTTPR